MQRSALALLFGVIALSLGAIAVWSALAGGRAWVIALAPPASRSGWATSRGASGQADGAMLAKQTG